MRSRPEATRVADAFLLRAVPFGEADLVTTWFTRSMGKVSALARGARKSQRRMSGAVEPFQTVRVTFEERPGELWVLRDADVVTVRMGLTRDLDAALAAGTVLRWVRALFAPRQSEPDAYDDLVQTLDLLDESAGRTDASQGHAGEAHATKAPNHDTVDEALVRAGFRLLSRAGYQLQLGACIRCGRARPPGRAALMDVRAGGIVCQACGGGSRPWPGDALDAATELVAESPSTFARVADDSSGSVDPAVGSGHGKALLALVTEAMAVHAQVDHAD